MPTQYIKTLGALTINDGDPTNPIDIRTGSDPANRGAITINGQPIGGGGGGGGDVYLDGAGGVAGQAYTKPLNFNSFPINNSAAGDAFVATGAGANMQSYDTVQANDPAVAGSFSEMKSDGTATFTGLVKVGDAGGAGNGLECKMDVQCEQDIKFTPVGGLDSILLDHSSQSVTARNITAYRAVQGQDGEVNAHTVKASGGVADPGKMEIDDDGELVTGKVTIGNSNVILNKVSLDRRNSAPGAPAADRKTDLVFKMPLSNYADPNVPEEGSAEIFFESNEPLSGGATNPAYQRLCKIEEQGFTACRPIRYLALQPLTGANVNQPSYAYAAEVYDVYKNAPNQAGQPAPSLDIITRFCNDLTLDVVPVAFPNGLSNYTLFTMTSSTAVHGNAAFPDAGFQSKYPANDGDANDIITWNVGQQAGDPGVNNFIPVPAPGTGLIEAFKRKHWRISFKQKNAVTATNAVPAQNIAIGDVVLENFEGYIDVCIAEFPTSNEGEFQYKQVCYGTSLNKLQTNAPPAGSRVESRGQVRLARRNQFTAGLGAWQFMMDFPSWDLTSLGGANNAAATMTLNFTFTCLQ
jgi:hypothetical protein